MIDLHLTREELSAIGYALANVHWDGLDAPTHATFDSAFRKTTEAMEDHDGR